jgi:hypothetical protein
MLLQHRHDYAADIHRDLPANRSNRPRSSPHFEASVALDSLTAVGKTIAEAAKSIEVTEQTYYLPYVCMRSKRLLGESD